MDTQLMNNIEKLEKLFGSRMGKYEEKLQKVSTEASPAPPEIATLASEFSDFKSFVWQTLSTFKSQIELLTLGLDRHETAMRRKVLLLHGIPEKPRENLLDVVHGVISNQLKLSEVSLEHLQVCHRLGSPQAKTRPVLVRFYNMEQRNLVWDSKTALKGTGITISEFLTKCRHRIFMSARSHFGTRQCWTTEGKITIMLPDKSKRKIESITELDSLKSQFPLGPEHVEDVQQMSAPKTNTVKFKRTRRQQ